MKIGIDVTSLRKNTTGIERHTFNLVEKLRGVVDEDDDLIFFLGYGGGVTSDFQRVSEIYKKSGEEITRGLQGIWEQTVLPFKIKQYDIDVYFCSRNYGIPFWSFNSVQFVLTIHDMIPTRFPMEYDSSMMRRLIFLRKFLSSRMADEIVTVSQFSREDIASALKLDPDSIHVIHNGIADHFFNYEVSETFRSEVFEKFNLSSPYMLMTGSNKPSNNNSMIANLWPRIRERNHRDNLQLLVTGDGWDQGTDQKVRKRDSVQFLGHVLDEELVLLMSEAELFLFPSLYEGFGLPPLEAMATGTPVVASSSSCLPEILGDAVLYAEPDDQDDWLGTIDRVLKNESLREELSEKGEQRSKEFRWENAARQLYELFEKTHKNSA